jgi:Fur family ferric uptake transcriptional regulator
MSCGERLEKELRLQGHRVTPQRAVILETIAHLEGHCSANEVFDQVRGRLPGLNLTTVYRTLEKLQHAGLIDLLAPSVGAMRFSLRDQSNKHGHLQCRVCGSNIEIPAKHFKAMLNEIKTQHQFTVEIDHLALQGICYRF